MQCIGACLQACRRNALSPGFSRRCFPLCQPGKTTFGEPVPPDLSHVASFLLHALRQSTPDQLHGSFSGTQDMFSRPPLRARSRPSRRLKPIPFRNGSARLKACPDTKPVIPNRAPKCRNSRCRHECRHGTLKRAPQSVRPQPATQRALESPRGAGAPPHKAAAPPHNANARRRSARDACSLCDKSGAGDGSHPRYLRPSSSRDPK